MALCLVTGGAGFIGSHLVEALLERGDSVRVLDSLETGRMENLRGLMEAHPERLEFLQEDLRSGDACARAVEGVDSILHQAALPSVPRSVQEPRPSHTINIDGTFNLLEAAVNARKAGRARVRRVTYAASSSAYGNQPGFPRKETMRPEPISPYAVQKLTSELYMQSFWRVYGLPTVSLRYFNIFGPRQDPGSAYSGVMARWSLQMLRGERPVIFGDGEQGRDFTYVANVVRANLLALEADESRVAGEVFNIGCGERHTLNETYRLLAHQFAVGAGDRGGTGAEVPEPTHGAPREGDVRDSHADISRAREALGYSPLVTFEEGLARTAAWYREQQRAHEASDESRRSRMNA